MGVTFNARMGQDVGQAHVLLSATVHSIGSADPFGPAVLLWMDCYRQSSSPPPGYMLRDAALCSNALAA